MGCRFLKGEGDMGEHQCRTTSLHSSSIRRGLTGLVVEKTADASLGGVEEGRGHGVVLPVGAEEL